MSQINLLSASDELRWFLRNNLTDSKSRGTTATANFTATASQTVFTISVSCITNIKSVTVNSVLKSFGFDYSVTISGTSATITLVTGATLNDPVAIVYHYGTTISDGTWVVADYPRADVKLSNIPLVNITDVSAVGKEIALGAGLTQLSILKSITVYDIDDVTVRNTLTEIKNKILANKKSFYNFNLIVPVAMGPFSKLPTDKKEIVYSNIDVEIPFIFEGTS
jgi:hypothetical protein